MQRSSSKDNQCLVQDLPIPTWFNLRLELLNLILMVNLKMETLQLRLLPDWFGNIIRIWCKLLQARNDEKAKTRATALSIGMTNALKLHSVVIEGDCKTVIDYISDQLNQIT